MTTTNTSGLTSDIHPCLTYSDAAGAIDWLCSAFGFSLRFKVSGENGLVVHAELSLGNGVVMVSSPKPEMGRFAPGDANGPPATLSVTVEDPDAHHASAMAAGAKIVQSLRDEEYGARGYMAEDPEGHCWYFGNYRPGGFWDESPLI